MKKIRRLAACLLNLSTVMADPASAFAHFQHKGDLLGEGAVPFSTQSLAAVTFCSGRIDASASARIVKTYRQFAAWPHPGTSSRDDDRSASSQLPQDPTKPSVAQGKSDAGLGGGGGGSGDLGPGPFVERVWQDSSETAWQSLAEAFDDHIQSEDLRWIYTAFETLVGNLKEDPDPVKKVQATRAMYGLQGNSGLEWSTALNNAGHDFRLVPLPIFRMAFPGLDPPDARTLSAITPAAFRDMLFYLLEESSQGRYADVADGLPFLIEMMNLSPEATPIGHLIPNTIKLAQRWLECIGKYRADLEDLLPPNPQQLDRLHTMELIWLEVWLEMTYSVEESQTTRQGQALRQALTGQCLLSWLRSALSAPRKKDADGVEKVATAILLKVYPDQGHDILCRTVLEAPPLSIKPSSQYTFGVAMAAMSGAWPLCRMLLERSTMFVDKWTTSKYRFALVNLDRLFKEGFEHQDFSAFSLEQLSEVMRQMQNLVLRLDDAPAADEGRDAAMKPDSFFNQLRYQISLRLPASRHRRKPILSAAEREAWDFRSRLLNRFYPLFFASVPQQANPLSLDPSLRLAYHRPTVERGSAESIGIKFYPDGRLGVGIFSNARVMLFAAWSANGSVRLRAAGKRPVTIPVAPGPLDLLRTGAAVTLVLPAGTVIPRGYRRWSGLPGTGRPQLWITTAPPKKYKKGNAQGLPWPTSGA